MSGRSASFRGVQHCTKQGCQAQRNELTYDKVHLKPSHISPIIMLNKNTEIYDIN